MEADGRESEEDEVKNYPFPYTEEIRKRLLSLSKENRKKKSVKEPILQFIWRNEEKNMTS